MPHSAKDRNVLFELDRLKKVLKKIVVCGISEVPRVIIKGKDILTNNVMGCYFHSGDMVDAPIVDKTEYLVANIEEQQLELLHVLLVLVLLQRDVEDRVR